MSGCEMKRRASDTEGSCPDAASAADHAAKKVFAILGVDIDKPESVEEFREDLRFGKRLRKAADHGVLVFIAIVTTAFAAALWAGVVEKIKGG